ncbi:MAG: competence protein ComEC [Actinomycetota bacterium]|jgi:competence protein ComEC|nr:competence protein ComEC [Actinomycetota bacterium]
MTGDRTRHDGGVPADDAAQPAARLDVRMGLFALCIWASVLVALGRGSRAVVVLVAGGLVVALAAAGPGFGVRLAAGGRSAPHPAPRWARPTGRIVAVVALGVVAGGGSCGFALAVRDRGPLHRFAAEGATVRAELVVRDDARRLRSGPVGRPLFAVPATVERIEVAGTRHVLGGRVLVLATDPAWTRPLPGQRVRAEGRLAPPRGGDLTAAVLTARGPPEPLGVPPWYQRAAGGLRAGLQRACAGLPPERGGLVPGLVIGDTSRLDPAVEESFRATGMTHLLAVSGSNCAIVVGAVLVLLRALRVHPRVAAAIAGAALVGFVVLARPSPSVLRAAAMGTVALVALGVGRPRAALPALSTAVAGLLLLDPGLARSPGFALSALATLGLVVLAPRWRDALQTRGVPRPAAEALAVPAAAQAACAPLLAALFGGVGLVAVPANLLAVPAVAPAAVLGVAAAVVSPVAPPVAAGLAWLASWPAWWLVEVARTGAAVPGGTLPWPTGAWGGLALAAVLLVAAAAARIRAVRRIAVAVVAAVVLVALPIRVVAPGWPPEGWRIVGCAVGQGDTEVLRAGPGSAVVVDAGPDPGAADACLRRLGVRAVPLLVLSHLHLDHVGGVAGVIRNRTVGAILTGTFDQPRTGRQLLADTVRRYGISIVRTGAGAAYQVGDVRLEVLGPVRRFGGTRSDPNNNSLVLRAGVRGLTILLPGDAELDAQHAMLARGLARPVDVLKVPHHGSSFSEPAFLDAARARVALVEVGAGNDYGHPDAAVLAHLRGDGTRVLRTDLDGDVAVVAEGRRLSVAIRGPQLHARSP